MFLRLYFAVAKKATAKPNAEEQDAKKPAASDRKGHAKSSEAEGKTAQPARAPVAEPSNGIVPSKSVEKEKKSSKKKKKSKKRAKHSSGSDEGSSSKKHNLSDDERDRGDNVSPEFRGRHTRFVD